MGDKPSTAGDCSKGLIELSLLAASVAENVGIPIEQASDTIVQCLRAGGRVLVCGNGGSAADAQHFAAELMGRFGFDRSALPVLALTVNSSVMTAVSNDYGFEDVFSRQVEGLGRSGDVLIGLSTSGKSPNVLKALETAAGLGLKTIALTGRAGNPILDSCDLCIHVPSSSTPRIQEIHIAILHAVCEKVEKEMFQ